MVRRFCHEDKGHPVSFEFIDERLLGIKAIATDDDFQSGMGSPYLSNQSLTGIGFTILLCGPIDIPYRFRSQWNHLFDARTDNSGGHHLMIISGRFVRCFRQAAIAGYLV